MTRRYYVPELPVAGGLVAIGDAEAEHALRVMRIRVGDRVTLFNGQGQESRASVTQIDRRSCLCDAEPAVGVDRELPGDLSLAVALPKPSRSREMVERLTELGVKRLIPMVTERSERPASRNQLDKLRRAVVEACKQSGRNQLMEITEPQPCDQLLMRPEPALQRWILQPNGDAIGEQLPSLPAAVIALVGPEGGWTDRELDRAVAGGYTPLSLGPRIYRIETAAVAIAAVVAAQPRQPSIQFDVLRTGQTSNHSRP